MRLISVLLLLSVSLFSMGCITQQKKAQIQIAPENPYICQGYREPENSPYVLPYPEGDDFMLVQGNCTRYSHNGIHRYAFDFGLPIGTEVVAARGGVVVAIDMKHPDSLYSYKRRYKRVNKAKGNCVKIVHEDGSVGYYYHLKQESALVEVGDEVKQGQVLALSGNSGFTTGPHLHFEVRRSMEDRQTIPVTFKNVDYAHNFQLQDRTFYTALPVYLK
jgi:murein DD-endopeptidase MepM/ murein hydrolase activator NlpD